MTEWSHGSSAAWRIKGVGLRSRDLSRPGVGDIAAPVDLHIYHGRLRELAHQFRVHLRELLQGVQRDGDPLIADCPEAHGLFAVVRRGHRHLHHWRGAVGQEDLGCQEGAHFAEHRAPFVLLRRLVQAQGSKK